MTNRAPNRSRWTLVIRILLLLYVFCAADGASNRTKTRTLANTPPSPTVENTTTNTTTLAQTDAPSMAPHTSVPVTILPSSLPTSGEFCLRIWQSRYFSLTVQNVVISAFDCSVQSKWILRRRSTTASFYIQSMLSNRYLALTSSGDAFTTTTTTDHAWQFSGSCLFTAAFEATLGYRFLHGSTVFSLSDQSDSCSPVEVLNVAFGSFGGLVYHYPTYGSFCLQLFNRSGKYIGVGAASNGYATVTTYENCNTSNSFWQITAKASDEILIQCKAMTDKNYLSRTVAQDLRLWSIGTVEDTWYWDPENIGCVYTLFLQSKHYITSSLRTSSSASDCVRIYATYENGGPIVATAVPAAISYITPTSGEYCLQLTETGYYIGMTQTGFVQTYPSCDKLAQWQLIPTSGGSPRFLLLNQGNKLKLAYQSSTLLMSTPGNTSNFGWSNIAGCVFTPDPSSTSKLFYIDTAEGSIGLSSGPTCAMILAVPPADAVPAPPLATTSQPASIGTSPVGSIPNPGPQKRTSLAWIPGATNILIASLLAVVVL